MQNMAIYNLKQFAYFQNIDKSLLTLKNLARVERWGKLGDENDIFILYNYINHTFRRLQELNEKYPEQNYLYCDNKIFCFNTGLFTRNFEAIYTLFTPNRNQDITKWYWKGFYKESDWELNKISKLPQRAKYFDKIEDLIFDTNREIRINIDHILEDENNRNRIPTEYKNASNLNFLFRSALTYAQFRIKENYKSAVPQYYNGKIQFLLPISLGDPSIVDLSLAVGKYNDIYTGHTCLTMDMAYNNARLIAKPESDWLVGR